VPAKTGRHGLRRAQSSRGRPYAGIWTMFLSLIRLAACGQRPPLVWNYTKWRMSNVDWSAVGGVESLCSVIIK